MKHISSIIIFVLGLLYLYQKGAIFQEFELVSAKKAYDMIKIENSDVIILDARTAKEYKNDGRIKNALSLPMLSRRDIPPILMLSKEKQIIVYSRNTRHGALCAKILTDVGFKKVYNIQDGIYGWRNSGYEVEFSDK